MSHKDTYIQQELQRGKEKAENSDSFIASNYWLWVIVAFIAYPLASILSAFTEGGHVFMRMSMTGLPYMMTILLTLMIAFLIELLSYFLGKGAVDDIQNGVFSKSGAHKAAFFVKFIGFIGIMGFSVYLSLSGAPLLNEKLRTAYTPPTADYISTDSITTYYDVKISYIRDDIDAAKATTWKGNITGSAMASIRNSQSQIKELEAVKESKISEADSKNGIIKSDWDQETDTNSIFAMGFAGLGEIIKLFCLLFIGIYDQGLSNEAAIFGGSGSAKSSRPYASSGKIGYSTAATDETIYKEEDSLPTARRLIGFNREKEGCKVTARTSSKKEDDNTAKTVATSSYYSKTDFSADAGVLKAAYAKAKSNRDSWEKKTPISAESKETKTGWIEKHQQSMNDAEAQLHKLGYQIELKGRRFRLIEIH